MQLQEIRLLYLSSLGSFEMLMGWWPAYFFLKNVDLALSLLWVGTGNYS